MCHTEQLLSSIFTNSFADRSMLCYGYFGKNVCPVLTAQRGKSSGIRTCKVTLPVWQCLSERLDSNSILSVLNEWLAAAGIIPKEVVVDNSSTLKSAIVKSFCVCLDTYVYKDKCLKYLIGRTRNFPTCTLRLDVANFINAVRKWNVWKHPSLRRIKDLYLRSLGILIKSTSLEDF